METKNTCVQKQTEFYSDGKHMLTDKYHMYE